MKKLSNGRKNTSIVYYLNDENKKKLEGLDNVVYSKTKNYAIIYTKEDLEYNLMLFEQDYLHRLWSGGSNEDMLYNTILHETKIDYFLGNKLAYQLIDDIDYENCEYIDDFNIPNYSPPFFCYINKGDSINQGSDILLVMGKGYIDSNKNNKDEKVKEEVLIYCQIKGEK